MLNFKLIQAKCNLTTAFLQFQCKWQCVPIEMFTPQTCTHTHAQKSLSIGLFAESVWFYFIDCHPTNTLVPSQSPQETYVYAIHNRVEAYNICNISQLDRASKHTHARISSMLRATTRAWRSISKSFIFRMSFNPVEIPQKWCSSVGMGRQSWEETPKSCDRVTLPMYMHIHMQRMCCVCTTVDWWKWSVFFNDSLTAYFRSRHRHAVNIQRVQDAVDKDAITIPFR